MEWFLYLLSLWMVWNLKYYYLAIFLPVAFTTLTLTIYPCKICCEKSDRKGNAVAVDIYDSPCPDEYSPS